MSGLEQILAHIKEKGNLKSSSGAPGGENHAQKMAFAKQKFEEL